MHIKEILTVDVLKQPSDEQRQQKSELASTHYRDTLYYHRNGQHLLVVSKNDDTVF